MLVQLLVRINVLLLISRSEMAGGQYGLNYDATPNSARNLCLSVNRRIRLQTGGGRNTGIFSYFFDR